MLSFPPHCSHKLQPLDRSVYGPFKKFTAAGQDAWLRNNPGKAMTIYDLPAIIRDAFPRAATPVNIINGFRISGISPFNADIFTDYEFAPSFVSDRPNPILPTEIRATSDPVIPTLSLPSTSNERISTSGSQFSPEVVRPFPKVGPRKHSGRGRKQRRSAVLTDTPVKIAIENEKRKSFKNKNVKKVSKSKKEITFDSSDEEECLCLVCLEPYENSKAGERWLQCTECKHWAHEDCTPNPKNNLYICLNCESDDDI